MFVLSFYRRRTRDTDFYQASCGHNRSHTLQGWIVGTLECRITQTGSHRGDSIIHIFINRGNPDRPTIASERIIWGVELLRDSVHYRKSDVP